MSFFVSTTVFKVHGAKCIQWLYQQLYQRHGTDQEGLLVQTFFSGLSEGTLPLYAAHSLFQVFCLFTS